MPENCGEASGSLQHVLSPEYYSEHTVVNMCSWIHASENHGTDFDLLNDSPKEAVGWISHGDLLFAEKLPSGLSVDCKFSCIIFSTAGTVQIGFNIFVCVLYKHASIHFRIMAGRVVRDCYCWVILSLCWLQATLLTFPHGSL